jgi:hypothetical protein
MFFGTVGGNGSLDVQGQLGLIYRQRFVVSVSGFKAGGMERAGWMVNAGGMW